MAPEMPERYLCPITTEIMMDPVMDLHGHNFERIAITEWLGRSAECPLSREAIHLSTLYPNLALREEISEWLAHSHPMFGFHQTVSVASSPTTSVGEPLDSTSPELPAAGLAPWERMNIAQDYYDRLLALFLSFGSGEMDKSKLQALCRYMNFVEALGHLDEVVPEDATQPVHMSFEEFVGFVQKYPPHPVLEYGMSEAEYAAILRKFQALDFSGQGKVSREAALVLVEDMKIECDREPLDRLPDPVALHDFLLWCKHCRLLVARRSSVLSTSSRPKVLQRLELHPLMALDQWKFPLQPRSHAAPGAAGHSPTTRCSPRPRGPPKPENQRSLAPRPAGSSPTLTRGSTPRAASPHRPLSKPSSGSDQSLNLATRLGSGNETAMRAMKLGSHRSGKDTLRRPASGKGQPKKDSIIPCLSTPREDVKPHSGRRLSADASPLEPDLHAMPPRSQTEVFLG
eukprot:EG_transcript_9337